MRRVGAALLLLCGALMGAAAGPRSDGPPPDELRPGQPVEGRIELGDPRISTARLVEQGRDAVVGRTYRLVVEHEGPYRVELRSYLFDSYLVVRDEAGDVLAEDDDSLFERHAQVVLSLGPQTPVLVQVCSLDGPGPFELEVLAGRPRSGGRQAQAEAEIADARRQLQVHRREGVDAVTLAGSCDRLGILLFHRGRLSEARELWEQALEIYTAERGPESSSVGSMLNNLALTYSNEGQLLRARSLLERSLAISEKADGPSQELATTIHNLASTLQQLGEYDAALALHERALALREEVLEPGHVEIAQTLNNMAMLYDDRGQLDRSVRLYARAAVMFEDRLGPDHELVGRCLGNLGVVFMKLEDYPRALAVLERSLVIAEESYGRRSPSVAIALNNLAHVRANQGDEAAALPLYERSLAILEASPDLDERRLATALDNLGHLYKDQGRLDLAQSHHERSLEIRRRLLGDDHESVGYSLNSLAGVAKERGQMELAAERHAEATALWERTLGPEHPLVATSLTNHGKLLRHTGDLHAARPLLERAAALREAALGIEHPSTQDVLTNLAAVLSDLGQAEAAQRTLARAMAGRRAPLAVNLAGLSEDEGRIYLAELLWQQELALSPALWSAGTPTAAYESLLEWKGQVLRAARAGRKRLREAFGAEDRARLDELGAVRSELAGLLAGQAPAESEAGEDANHAGRIDELVTRRRQLERELRGDGRGPPPTAPTAPIPASVPTWTALRDALPPHSVLVDVFVHRVREPARWEDGELLAKGEFGAPRASAWITLPDANEPVHVDLGPVADIESALTSELVRDGTARGNLLGKRLDADESDLGRRVWAPLEPHIGAAELVIVSPDQALATLPWQVLRNGDGRYLVQDRSFVYLTDPTTLVEIMAGDPVRTPGTLLAVGGVDYASPPESSSATASVWMPLPATAGEAQAVMERHRRAGGAADRQLVTGSDATEANLKALMPSASIVHLATHGYFLRPTATGSDAREAAGDGTANARDVRPPANGSNDANDVDGRRIERQPGMLSGLVCAAANGGTAEGPGDGYLTADEVAWLDLTDCELVVLSACDTGQGRAASGEGLLGLRRAFQLAGADTVISSLWNVPDQETAELMDRFYANLWDAGLGTAEALRAAQLAMIENGADASEWGAFVVDGDWR